VHEGRTTTGVSQMKTAKDVLKLMKDQDVKYVDFRFTEPRGNSKKDNY
jgi:glutamine synthetase